MNVNWIKLNDGGWWQLHNLNLADPHFNNLTGVYLIWHGGQQPKWVRAGQGSIKDRLSEHRGDADVLNYRQHGLFVTWARVAQVQLDGVEAVLGAAMQAARG